MDFNSHGRLTLVRDKIRNVISGPRIVERVVKAKVAVPLEENKGLESRIAEHFGHAPYFAIAEVSRQGYRLLEILENPMASEHGPGQLPRWLASLGVDTLVARGMGWRAVQYFNEMGVQVYRGATGTLREVLEALAGGRVEDREYEPREKWRGGGCGGD